MATQLGLLVSDEDNASSNEEQSDEEKRTALAVYFLTSSASTSLRKPRSLPWTRRLQASLEYFHRKSTVGCAEALQVQIGLDRELVSWVELQRVAEAGSEAVGVGSGRYDGNAAAGVEVCLTNWEHGLDGPGSESLRVYHAFLCAKMHETALRASYCEPRELIPPYEAPIDLDERWRDLAESTMDVKGIRAFFRGCRDIVSAFVGIELASLASCPAVTFVRVAYATKGLALLLHRSSNADSTVDDAVIAEQNIRAVYCHLDEVAVQGQCKVARMVKGLVRSLLAKSDGSRGKTRVKEFGRAADPTIGLKRDQGIRSSIPGTGALSRQAHDRLPAQADSIFAAQEPKEEAIGTWQMSDQMVSFGDTGVYNTEMEQGWQPQGAFHQASTFGETAFLDFGFDASGWDTAFANMNGGLMLPMLEHTELGDLAMDRMHLDYPI
jgi:hypothetical protein